jgi:hypothetical protein
MGVREMRREQVQRGFSEKAQMSRKGEHLSFFGMDNGLTMSSSVETAAECRSILA